MKAIIDLIIHLKWKNLFVLFQDPNRVEELIRFADFNYPKIYIQFRIISSNSTNWEYLINYIKSTAYSNLIIDLDDKLINKFLDIVKYKFYIFNIILIKIFLFNIKAKDNGIITPYYHLIFTSLDLSIISNEIAANITGFQISNSHSSKVKAFYSGLDLKRIKLGKTKIKYKPVSNILFII
jgi:hypothetical protein